MKRGCTDRSVAPLNGGVSLRSQRPDERPANNPDTAPELVSFATRSVSALAALGHTPNDLFLPLPDEAPTMEAPTPTDSASGNRTRAALAILPFLLLGLADVVLLLFWGLNPLWGFVILAPILFISVLGWIAFKTGFVRHDGAPDVD